MDYGLADIPFLLGFSSARIFHYGSMQLGIAADTETGSCCATFSSTVVAEPLWLTEPQLVP